jgi:uncharacterized protein (DUF2235 family)
MAIEMLVDDEPPKAATVGTKSIVLFSDGTGNSSAKLFKTNVWRMYEAVDLGPPASGKRPQISYYDDGVGTSSFKPLAALGGAFGWGLKRNVLDIYRFACRNYRDGDDIYAFGFSRGAFTARLVVALIASEGLVRSTDEADLQRKTIAAYRDFRRHFLPRRLQWPTKLLRKLRKAALASLDKLFGRASYKPSENARPKIRFIGVWDTVAAYGGPITEITRAVDNWFFPLSMPDYALHENVRRARHALALDDERDAFQPLLWDEVHEKQLQEKQEELLKEGRLKKEDTLEKDRVLQVWFTGMHADVGGGYPDESLSYVSLLWMMEEAEHAGLRTLDVVKERFVALASSFGPIHDSRAGVAAYYRYQPRKIAAWLNPANDATLSLRDPVITDDRGLSRGLLRSVNVHESVINRIATGTDRYAPITLPGTFDIVPPQEHGENVPQADSETPAPAHGTAASKPMLDRRLVALLKDQTRSRARGNGTEAVWNRVWWRRVIYFLTLAATLLLVGLPIIINILPEAPVLTDGRTWIGGFIRLLTIILPAFAGRWIDVYADNPFYFLLFGAFVLILLSWGAWMERRLRDESRRVWRESLAGNAVSVETSWVEAFRNGPRYQWFLRLFKWYVLPDWVIAPLTVVVLSWALFAAYVQATLPFLENGSTLCKPSPAIRPALTEVSRDFFPRDVCSQSFGRVEKGKRYVVTFDVLDPWYDATLPTTPQGLSAGEFPWGLGYIAAPLKRVIDAHYLQPLIQIRPTDGKGPISGNIQMYALDVRQVGDEDTLFRADFKAQRDGELFLFVNDAMLPFTGSGWGDYDYRYFYRSSGGTTASERGNRGSACVTIESAATRRSTNSPTPGSVCEKTAQRRSGKPGDSLQAALRTPQRSFAR